MRVLHVSDAYPPATGGLERAVQAMARETAIRGHRVAVATLSYPGAPAHEQDGDVDIHRLEGWTRHLQRFSADPGHHFHPTTVDPQLVARLHELIADVRPDVVHAHGWILNSCLSLRLPPGAVLVTTLHDYSTVCAKKSMIRHEELDRTCPGPTLRDCLSCTKGFYGVAKGAALTLGLRERRHRLDRVSMFLPISDSVAAVSLPGVESERIRIVAPFVADDVALEAVGVPRPDFLPDGDYLLFVGALGEHKGVGLLAEAHQRMQHPVPLVLIGTARADTPALVGTPDRPVIVRTDVPHRQIMAAFSSAAAAVVPSRWPEPLGLVAVEALAVGTPVVATRMGALPEVVADGVTGLIVPPGDTTALAAALDRIVSDRTLRARLGAAGAGQARTYTASVVMPSLLAAYDDALCRTAVPLSR